MSTVAAQTHAPRSLIPIAEALRGSLMRDLAPHEFFDGLLNLLTAEDEQPLAAVWMAGPNHSLCLFTDVGFNSSGMLDDRLTAQSNQELLLIGWQSDQPIWLKKNCVPRLDSRPVLLIPIRQQGQRLGVVQLLTEAFRPGAGEDAAAAEIMEVIDLYFRRSELQAQALEPQRSQTRLAKLIARLHVKLDPQLVAQRAVDEVSTQWGCERAWLFEFRGGNWKPTAVSGQTRIHASSPQVRQLQGLIQETAAAGKRFLYHGESAGIPDRLARSLITYVLDSGVQLLLVEPVFFPPSARNSQPRAVLVCEQFREQLPAPGLTQQIGLWGTQIGMALANARAQQRLLAIPGMRFLARGVEQKHPSTRLRTFGLLTSVLTLLAAACLFETELHVPGHGRLLPETRRSIFATRDGEVAEVFVKPAQRVSKGEPLVRLHAPQLEQDHRLLASQLEQKFQRRDVLRGELRQRLAEGNRGAASQCQAELDAVSGEISAIEKQLELLAQEQRRLLLLAPIAGTVTTPHPQERLLHRPVQSGESILEIMDENGSWELQLDIAERRAGPVLNRAPQSKALTVDFRLAAQPEVLYAAELSEIPSQMTPAADGNSLSVSCHLNDSQLPEKTIGAEASARIDCGRRRWIQVIFGEFQQFLQREWWL